MIFVLIFLVGIVLLLLMRVSYINQQILSIEDRLYDTATVEYVNSRVITETRRQNNYQIPPKLKHPVPTQQL